MFLVRMDIFELHTMVAIKSTRVEYQRKLNSNELKLSLNNFAGSQKDAIVRCMFARVKYVGAYMDGEFLLL